MATEKLTDESGDGTTFCWEGKKVTVINDMSMPCNLSLPGACGEIRFTKLGVLSDGVTITRTSLLWYGKTRMVPLLFIMNDGVSVSETTLEFEPKNVRCYGPVIQDNLTASPQMVLLPLGSADSQENLLSAGCAVQAQAASAKMSLNQQWEGMATAFEEHVEFKDAFVFKSAFENGESLCKEETIGACRAPPFRVGVAHLPDHRVSCCMPQAMASRTKQMWKRRLCSRPMWRMGMQ